MVTSRIRRRKEVRETDEERSSVGYVPPGGDYHILFAGFLYSWRIRSTYESAMNAIIPLKF